jgi:hypothetical protein
MMKSSQHTLTLLFLITLAVSLSLWIHAVFTTVIGLIDLGYLPIFRELPASYWVGFVLIILATIIWYCSPQTRSVHFLLVLFWTLFLFVGPELAAANIRGNEGIFFTAGTKYMEAGRFSEYMYSAHHGLFAWQLALHQVTNIAYHDLAKFTQILVYFLRPLAMLAFVSSLFTGNRERLLATLLLLALACGLAATWLAPMGIGSVFFFFFLSLLFNSKMPCLFNRILLLLFFASMMVTHALSSLISITVIIVFVLTFLVFTKRYFSYREDLRGYVLPLLFSTGFVAWIMYSSPWGMELAISNIREFVIETPFFLPFVERVATHPTLYKVFRVGHYLLFVAVLGIWLITIVVRKDFRSNLSLEKVFPLLVPITFLFPIFFTGVYRLDPEMRFFTYAIPFLAWFIIRESRIRQRITIYFLIILLVLSFSMHYTNAWKVSIPTTEFAGAEFLSEKAPLHSTIFYNWWCPVGYMAFNIDAPHTVSLREVKARKQELRAKDFDFIIESPLSSNAIIYENGEEEYQRVRKEIYDQTKSNIIYSNGDFTVYSPR